MRKTIHGCARHLLATLVLLQGPALGACGGGGAAVPTSWSGSIDVSMTEDATASFVSPPDGLGFLGATATASRRISVIESIPVATAGVRPGVRATLQVGGVTGSGSIQTARLVVSDSLEDYGTALECRIVTRSGETVSAPTMTGFATGSPGLTLNADGSYVLDFGGNAVTATGPASVRTFAIRSLSPLETRSCGDTSGGTDVTTPGTRAIGVGAADLPDVGGTVGVDGIVGTASKTTDLSIPAEGQVGSRRVEVTWTLRSVP
jgi:hypothetical protein